MIVLLLVLIWLIVLTPVIGHRLTSANLFTSVSRYRSGNRLAQRVLGRQEDALPRSRPVRPARGESHRETALRSAERERQRRERRRMVLRRRRTIASLVASLIGSVVLGAIPPLRTLWDLSAVVACALAGYLVLLARVTRLEANATERREKVIVLPQTIFPVALADAGAPRPRVAVHMQGV